MFLEALLLMMMSRDGRGQFLEATLLPLQGQFLEAPHLPPRGQFSEALLLPPQGQFSEVLLQPPHLHLHTATLSR